LAGGSQYVSWIHIEDEVGILLWALDNDKVGGAINSTAPNPVTNRELSRALGEALHRPAAMPVPGITLDLMYGREFGHVLRGGQRVYPRRALDLGYEFRFTDIDEALADLL
jgi:NAD dependent epimerase/dehydratase family enzyme